MGNKLSQANIPYAVGLLGITIGELRNGFGFHEQKQKEHGRRNWIDC
jgi:hypothetical protein